MNTRENKLLMKKYQPFIKWVGGKRGLLTQLLKIFPKKFNNYHEPFLGGGAVFFELYSKGLLKNKKIYLSDINSELINTYNVVKKYPHKLINNLENFKEKHSEEFYYNTREIDRKEEFNNLTKIERATRFIYLNKTCFNGLYRVNKKGQFNTPIGSYKNPNIADKDVILSASKALENAIISDKPFNEVINNTTSNDLVYFDPPYYPLNVTSSFTAYNENDFLDKKQEELFNIFEELHEQGCFVLHSNSDTKFIHSLYIKYQKHAILMANRNINSDITKRQKIKELLIRSFKDE